MDPDPGGQKHKDPTDPDSDPDPPHCLPENESIPTFLDLDRQGYDVNSPVWGLVFGEYMRVHSILNLKLP
jgi:hypothetical protein